MDARTAPIIDSATRLLIRIGGGPLARAWLVGPGDACAGCAMAPECPDRRRCLHLVASAGSTTRLDGPYRRFPIGARRVGQVASTRRPFIAHEGLESLAEPAWLAAHQVSGFGAWPLVAANELLGVIAAFSRRPWSEEEARNAEAVAILTASAIASVQPTPLASSGKRSVAISGGTTGDEAPSLTLAEIQRGAIEDVLARTAGRVSGPRGAAHILGLKPTTLISRMQKLKVKRPPRRL